MKVLHLYKDYSPVLGGIENHIRVLAEGQVRAGHDVTVLAASLDFQRTDRTLHGVKVVQPGRLATLASTPICPGLFTTVRTIPADIVHLHFPHPPGELAQLWCGRSKATVLTYHSDIVRQRRLLRVYAPLLRRVLTRVDRIIVTCPPYAETSAYLAAVRPKCRVVPLGIDTTRFDPSPARGASVRQRLGLAADETIAIFVGRLRYYKGLEFLVAALPSIPGVRLLLVGDGPLLGDVRAQATALGVLDRIVFAGDVSETELPSYYAAADLFVLPSHTRAEAFGISVVEAMASGIPVITTEIGTGTSWVNQDGQTGYVVPPANPAALATAIGNLAQSPARREAMGRSGRQRAVAVFGADAMIDGVEQVYREVLADTAFCAV
jgi:glycosyltransferase involved in cell wall biosynthesis